MLFFAVLFGIGLALVGRPTGQKVTDLIEAISTVLFKVRGLIVRVAPLGVLGAVAYTVGRYGVGSLKQVLSLVLFYYVSVPAIGLVLVLSVEVSFPGRDDDRCHAIADEMRSRFT